MTDAHRAASDHPPRPPWEVALIGVRCPSCGLGGDIPETIVRTLCPRCDTAFEVALARAERPSGIRPAAVRPPIPQPPVALAPILLPPVPPVTPVTADPTGLYDFDDPLLRIEPLAPDDPLALAGLALIPASSRERTTRPAASHPSSSAAHRHPAARPRRRVRIAAIGVSMFALGAVAGWTVFRDDGGDDVRADAPTEVRDATAERAIDGVPGTLDDGSATEGPADTPSGGTSDSGSAKTASGKSSSSKSSSAKKSSSKSSSRQQSTRKSSAKRSSDRTTSEKKSSGRSSSGSSTTTERDGTTTSRPAATERQAGGFASTTVAAAPATTIGVAPPALPGVTLPAVRVCSGLDCHMTVPSGFDGIPVPDDAVELTTATGVIGWTTQVASIEVLTAWYLDHLTELGWVLNGPASVMDPTEGEAHELGHSTSAIYCPSDSDDPIVAINVGWPEGDSSGETVVIGFVGGIDDSACD